MTKQSPKDITASLRQRLLNKARESGRPFNELLQYYAMERFLYRLAKSSYAKEFVLKGALMFRVWQAPSSRPTIDIDLLGKLKNEIDEIETAVRDICKVNVEPDGLLFDPGTVRAERITEDADYHGVRVRFRGSFSTARITMQIDIGFGDIVIPKPSVLSYPTILDLPAPRLQGYSKETTIAEKFEAMTKLGIINSRMKDFYDVWLLLHQYDFDGELLGRAINETFSRRGTPIQPATIALRPSFAEDYSKQTQWRAFVEKSRLDNAPLDLKEVVNKLASFLVPVATALTSGKTFRKTWLAPGPWK